MLNRGEVPIFEPGLAEMIRESQASGRISFTTDIDAAVEHGLFQFIAVGTPPDEDGSADLKYVKAVAKSIGQRLNDYRIIVDKSTVPVGTADEVKTVVQQEIESRNADIDFDVVSNPEFLKEGDAIGDFMKPDRIIVGTENPRTAELLKSLYAPFNRNHDRMLIMDVRSAELTKYAANAMLATKISFMNELANIAERVGADIEMVRKGIGSDSRIGYSFIYPGAGYGGSCFPKDVQALGRTAQQNDYRAELLDAVERVNAEQKMLLFRKIHAHFNGNLQGKTIALWGLSFKPNTDDMREAPSRTLIEALWQEGAKVRAYDPQAMEEAGRIYGERSDLSLLDDSYDALQGADALVVVTEWKNFRSPDLQRIKDALKQAVIFDGRNIYDPDLMRQEGITYYGIGRGQAWL